MTTPTKEQVEAAIEDAQTSCDSLHFLCGNNDTALNRLAQLQTALFTLTAAIASLQAENARLKAERSQRQPIETAPKDGTAILVLGGLEFTSIHISRYDADNYSKSPIPHFTSRWTSNRKYLSKNPPTHWMPLPEPPAAPEPQVCDECGDAG